MTSGIFLAHNSAPSSHPPHTDTSSGASTGHGTAAGPMGWHPSVPDFGTVALS